MPWEFSGEKPIYAQLVEELEKRIITGVYPPGERLASVRELAEEAAVNPNTMQRAMSALESGGLVYSQRTAGRFVTEDTERIAAVREELAQSRVAMFLREMDALGYSRSEAIRLADGQGGGNGA